MSPNAHQSTRYTLEDWIQDGKTAVIASRTDSQTHHELVQDETQPFKGTFLDEEVISPDSDFRPHSRHGARSSQKLSNELHFRSDVTRDSLVINLLSSFNQLPGGQGPGAEEEEAHFQSRFTSTDIAPEPPLPTASDPRPFGGFSSSATHSEPLAGSQKLSPYQTRTKPAKPGTSSQSLHKTVELATQSVMESPSNTHTNTSSMPSTAVSSKVAEKKRQKSKGSRGSNKSLGQGEISIDKPNEQGGATQGRSSASFDLNPNDRSRRRSRTNPPSASILNRSRPVPAEYYNFDGTSRGEPQWTSRDGGMSQQTPRSMLSERQSSAVSLQHNVEPRTSTRSKASYPAGSDRGLMNSPTNFSTTQNSSRQPSIQLLSAPADLPGFTAPSSAITNGTTPDVAKGKQGFFRRVFGSSNKMHSPAQVEQVQQLLPPIQTAQHADSKRSRSALSNNIETVDRRVANEGRKTSSNAPPGPPEVPVEQPHVIHKKTSFFRRKKWSPSLTNELNELRSGTQTVDTSDRLPSPSVSSLREVMNPFLNQTSTVAHPAIASPVETTYYDSRGNQSLDGDDQSYYASRSPRQEKRPSKPAGEDANASMISSVSSRHIANKLSASKRSERGNGVREVPMAVLDNRSFLYDSSGALTPAQKSSTHFEKSPQSEVEDEASIPHIADVAFPYNSHKPSQSITTDDSGPSIGPHRSDVTPSKVRVIYGDDPEEEWVVRTTQKPSAALDSGRTKRIWLYPSEAEVTPDNSAHASRMASISSAPSQDFARSSSPPLSQVDGTVSRSTSVTVDSIIDTTVPTQEELAHAKQLFDGSGNISNQKGALLLGHFSATSEKLRHAYMALYDFAGLNILLALRDLCGRLVLKGETQQVDRILTAFAQRWIDCNINHGFKNQDVVHTMCYSLLLLNTDLHIAEMDQKMTKAQFVRNTLETIRQAENEQLVQQSSTLRAEHASKRGSIPWRETRSPSPASLRRPSADIKPTDGRLSLRPLGRPISEAPSPTSPSPFDTRGTDNSDLLVNTPFEGSVRGWEAQVENVLKEFYLSIRQQRLPLYGASDIPLHDSPSSNSLGVGGAILRRPSVLSKAPSESARRGADFHSWNIRSRSKQRLYQASTHGSSRTSFDEGSVFSPNASSTWSRSFGRAPTSMSSDSIASHFAQSDYGFQQSIGFANALSHAIIREEDGVTNPEEEGGAADTLLEDDSLELEGAPWAKEGIVQHKHHMETTQRKAKDRNWSQCFVVVDKGCMRLFSFSSKASIRSQKNRSIKGGAVGGGNWMDSAEAIGTFTLRQTIANTLPAPGYSKSRQHVFALVLPTGAVHLFHVGTPEIAKEFVSTANYWSARLSKEPLVGGVSNIEYGWSENVINMALVQRSENSRSENSHPPSSAAAARKLHSPTPSTGTISGRPSFQGSLRGGSIDLPGRSRLPGDRIALSEWIPPQHSLGKSGWKEKEQLEALKRYVKDVEDELRQHNELRPAILLTYSPRQPNASKAMANWERKSSYLLREIVKFGTYIDALVAAEVEREKIYRERAERLAPTATAEIKIDPQEADAQASVG